ncbi:MAG: Hpt domain-containing protein [Oscillospiraceae bacterium]
MDNSSNNLFKALKDLGVDVDGTISRFVDNSEIYIRFLKRFPDEDRLTPIKDAIKAKDYDKLLQAAHKLKGVSANLGMNELSGKAAKIVDKVRSGNYDGFEADSDSVEEAYNIICDTIKNNI